MAIQTAYPPAPTHPKTHPAKRAVTYYEERTRKAHSEAIDRMCDYGRFDYAELDRLAAIANEAYEKMLQVYHLVLAGDKSEASRLWADFCQAHQLCLECGGELAPDTTGGMWFVGMIDDDLEDRLICRECGAVSNWKPVCETGEELPI